MSEKLTEGKMAHANVHASSRSGGFVFLLITATGWALNWPAMKILLREWPPLFSRGVAGVTAALILAALAASRGDSLRVAVGLDYRDAAPVSGRRTGFGDAKMTVDAKVKLVD